MGRGLVRDARMSRRKALGLSAVTASTIPLGTLSAAFSLPLNLSGCRSGRVAQPTRASSLSNHASGLAIEDDFSGAILLARNGRIEFDGAYGLADRQTRQPNTTATKFNLASVSKMFTAVCILQLVDQGSIALEDPLERHLPDYPNRAAAKNVKIKHLLLHTSGVGNYWAGLEMLEGAGPESHRDYLPLFASIPLEHDPGTSFSYSNGGYIVLGLIIERITRQSYYDYVQQAIFDKVAMRDTGFRRLDERVPNRARSYMRSVEHPGEWDDTTARSEPRGSAAGGAYSTVKDLYRFATALEAHRLLSPESTETFLQGRLDTPVGRYGYGVIEQSLNGTRVLGHSGGHYGVAAELMMFPEIKTTFVVLSNGDVDGYWDMEMFVHELIAGPTDETRAYAFTKDLIAAVVSKGYDTALSMFRSQTAQQTLREGVIDLAAFKYIHRGGNHAGLDLLRFNQAINPESDDAMLSMAHGYRLTGRDAEDLEAYRAYLDRVPDSVEAQAFVERLNRKAAGKPG